MLIEDPDEPGVIYYLDPDASADRRDLAVKFNAARTQILGTVQFPAGHADELKSGMVRVSELRSAPVIAKLPGLAAVRDQLLAIGGVAVVLEDRGEFSEILSKKGRVSDLPLMQADLSEDGKSVGNDCHEVSFLLHRQSRQFRMWHGYALNEYEDLWVAHTWVVRDGKILEPTITRRTTYFGFSLGEMSIGRFRRMGNFSKESAREQEAIAKAAAERADVDYREVRGNGTTIYCANRRAS